MSEWKIEQPVPTLRQWYAGLAMQALLTGRQGTSSTEWIARLAFEQADALIRAEQEQKDDQ